MCGKVVPKKAPSMSAGDPILKRSLPRSSGGLYTSLQQGQKSFTPLTLGVSLSPTGSRGCSWQNTRGHTPKCRDLNFSN